MRRFTHAALAISFAVAGFASVAADIDPTTLVDCEPEDGVTYVVEGEPNVRDVMGAPLTFPVGDAGWLRPADDPTGGVILDVVRITELYAMNHVAGQRATVTLKVDWDGVGDIDIDVFDADDELVADGHNFNTYGDDTSELASWSPEACATYSVVISNNLAVPAQNLTLTTEVTSKAPRVR